MDLDFESIDTQVDGTRGDRAALTRRKRRSAESEFVIETLVVLKVDRGGRWLASVLFDQGDLDAARAELDALAMT